MIRDATPDDAAAIAALYNPYVRDTVITFEFDEVSCEDMGARIAKVLGLGLPWIVAEEAERLVGFAYAAPYRPRAAYLHSVESTIYLAQDAGGRGLGKALYGVLLERLKHSDAHSAISLIALPNEASMGLHKALGFREVGVLREVGRKFDQWIDVAYLQHDLA
jgi:L-amino acid N-acyltransferase YncA